MHVWILTFTFLVSLQAFADKIESKVEDLNTEVEAEQMEVYDNKLLDQQARQEAAALERQSRSLEAQMQQLREESKNLSTRIGHEQERYVRLSKLAREAQVQARRVEFQRNKLKSQVESLRAKTDQSKSRLQSAEELTRSMSKEIREQNRERAQLLARQRAADQKIQKAARDIKRLRAQQHRLNDDNNRLQQSVAGRENRARMMDEKSLASEL